MHSIKIVCILADDVRLCPHTKAHWLWWQNLRDQTLPARECTPAPLPVPFISLDPHLPQAHQVPSASIGLFIPLPQTPPPPPPHRAEVLHVALNPTSPEDSSSHHPTSLCEDTAQNFPWDLPGTLHTLSCVANFLSLNLIVHKWTQTVKVVRVSASWVESWHSVLANTLVSSFLRQRWLP